MNNYPTKLSNVCTARILCVGASIIRRVLDEAIHTRVMRLRYSKANVHQQRAIKRVCGWLHTSLLPGVSRFRADHLVNCEKTAPQIMHFVLHSISSRSAILISG